MIITCPACQTRYMVPTQKLGSIGRVVRCLRCQHEWHQEAPARPQATQPDIPFPHGNTDFMPHHLPVVAAAEVERRNAVLSAVGAIAILLLVLGSLVAFSGPLMRELPMLTAVFEPFGMAPAPATPAASAVGLTINNIHREVQEDDGFVTYIIKGRVTNTNPSQKEVPNLRIALLNAQGIALDAWRVQPQKRTLSPGESTNWICHFYNPPLNNIAKYEIRFTNTD